MALSVLSVRPCTDWQGFLRHKVEVVPSRVGVDAGIEGDRDLAWLRLRILPDVVKLVVSALEERDDSKDDDDGECCQLGEHEGFCRLVVTLMLPTVEPGQEGDAEGSDQLEGHVRDIALWEDWLQQIVGHRKGHDHVRSGAEKGREYQAVAQAF